MKFEDEITQLTNQVDNMDINNQNGEINNNEEEDDIYRKHRSTFCGTAEYVSPEMLFGEEVGVAADYWALGCILYKLITGTSPFKEKSQFLVFQNIKTLNIKWPNTISIEAKDLIKKLLKHKPSERIGYYSIDEIIEHKFFLDSNGNNVIKSMELNCIPHRDSIKLKTQIEENIISDKKVKEKNNEGGANNNNVNTNDSIFKSIPQKSQIKIIKEQVVEKKSPYLHYNTRLLRLDNTPKIEYSVPDTKLVKGTIYLSPDCEAKVLSTSKFELITNKRTFLFKVKDDEAGVWGKVINEEIAKLSDPEFKVQYNSIINKETSNDENGNKKVYK